jgi:hypothetical protein
MAMGFQPKAISSSLLRLSRVILLVNFFFQNIVLELGLLVIYNYHAGAKNIHVQIPQFCILLVLYQACLEVLYN